MSSHRIHSQSTSNATPTNQANANTHVAFDVGVHGVAPSRMEIARAMFARFGFTDKDAAFLQQHYGVDPVRYFAETLKLNPRSITIDTAHQSSTVRISLSTNDYQSLRALAAERQGTVNTPVNNNDAPMNAGQAVAGRNGIDTGAMLRTRVEQQSNAAPEQQCIVPDAQTSNLNATQSVGKPVSQMTTAEKLGAAIERAASHLPSEAAAKLRSLATPEALATMVGVTALWAGSQFVPVLGEVVDVALLAYAAYALGGDALSAGSDLVSFASGAMNAQTEADLDAAGTHLARAVSTIGVDGALVLLTHKAAGTVESVVPEAATANGLRAGMTEAESLSASTVTEGATSSFATTTNASSTSLTATESGRGVYFFGEDVLPYIDRPDATLGRAGDAHFFMPLEDATGISTTSQAMRASGGAPSITKAYVNETQGYGVSFPTEGLNPRIPTIEDAGGFEHFFGGGHTALHTAEPNGGFLLNTTRELVVPGGAPIPEGSVLFEFGPNGVWTPLRRF